MFTKGFEKLEKEIHVTKIIKQIRVLKGIIKQSMHHTHWQQAYVKYSLKSLDVNKSETDGGSERLSMDDNVDRFNLRRVRTKDIAPD